MPQFARKMTTTFRWWNEEEGEIPVEHKIQLEDEAEGHINWMRGQGLTSGELISIIDDIDYRGHWEFTYVSDKENS